MTYQVLNVSGTAAASIAIGEVVTESNWNCSQADPGTTTTPYGGGTTDASGYFTDTWYLSPNFTPAGCGFDITDRWQWDPGLSLTYTFGTLVGFIHTDASQINGFSNPPTPMPKGTVINP